MSFSIADLRQNYTKNGLTETEAPSDPFELFGLWLDQAIASQILEPNAMTLATVTHQGYPTARMVLLKGFDSRGFVFYTNYQSAKGQQLAHNPQASLVFWWAELERQVRVEGTAIQLPGFESDSYFDTRPRESQLGAWVSPQSQTLEGRSPLEERLVQLQQQYPSPTKIPRPEHWGGYRISPKLIEFWQGRPSRLHDRLCYGLNPETTNWEVRRLAP